MMELGSSRFEDDEIATLLATYARAALSPSDAGRARVRSAVMAEARARLGAPASTRSPRAARRWQLSLAWRRPAIGFAAAGLAIAALAGGTVAASPGGPLYGARIWVETLSLPTEASARTDAEVARLEARLTDAQISEAAGNGPAVQAALDAYRSILDETMAAAGSDPTLQDKLEVVLERHVTVLQTLADQATVRGLPSADALQAAADRSEARIEEFVQDHPIAEPGNDGQGNGPGATGQPGNNGQGNNGQGNGPGATGQPGNNGQGNGQGNGPGATGQPGNNGQGNGPASPKPSHQPASGKPGGSGTPGGKGQSGGAGGSSSSAASTPAPQPTPRPTPQPKPSSGNAGNGGNGAGGANAQH